MGERKTPGKKTYDGKVRGEPFDIINRCQSLASEVFNASAGATKEYRFTVCKYIQTDCCNLIHTARQANAIELNSPLRVEKHKEALELMERIIDMLPVLRKCRCITPNQERELHSKVSNLKYGYNKWIESDKYRISSSKG